MSKPSPGFVTSAFRNFMDQSIPIPNTGMWAFLSKGGPCGPQRYKSVHIYTHISVYIYIYIYVCRWHMAVAFLGYVGHGGCFQEVSRRLCFRFK